MNITIKTENAKATYKFGSNVQYKVFNEIIKFFENTESFTDESMVQNDDATVEALRTMAKIAKILEWNVTWDDDE